MTRGIIRGQVWSFDFTIGLLLFLFSILAALAILFNTVLLKDSFSDVARSAEALSDQLMGTGYPPYWRVDDVITAGLLTDDGLSMRKAERLAKLVANDPSGAKEALNTYHEYAITFTERNGSILPVMDSCFIGSRSVGETKSVFVAKRRVAYYYRSSGSQMLKATMDSLVATPSDVFVDDGLSGLLEATREYDIIVLEEPSLSSVRLPYDAKKGALLSEFVRRGGTLIIIGDLNLSELFSLNISALNETVSSTGAATNDEFLNLSGLEVTDVASGFALNGNGLVAYESLLPLPDGRDLVGRLEYGDGDAYFIGSLDGDIASAGMTLLQHVEARLAAATNQSSAVCDSVTLPLDDAEHLVTVKRLVAYKGRVLTMSVSSWEPK